MTGGLAIGNFVAFSIDNFGGALLVGAIERQETSWRRSAPRAFFPIHLQAFASPIAMIGVR